MAYATVDDLKTRFGADVEELLDRDADGNEDDGIADTALNDASAEMDAILGARYVVPVQDVPYLLGACCDVARYRLYDDQVPEIVKERYLQVIKQLQLIARGDGELIGSDNNPIGDREGSASSAGGAVYKKPREERIFSDRSLSNFMGPL